MTSGSPSVLSFLATSGGQGTTTLAVAVAFELASQGRRVLLVDYDEDGGAIAAMLKLTPALTEGRSVRQLSVESGYVSVDTFLAAAVPVPACPMLAVIPGFCGTDHGSGVDAILPRMVAALRRLPFHVVILDLGQPLVSPMMGPQGPVRAARAIRQVSSRVFCVLRDDPLRWQRAIGVLDQLQEDLQPEVLVWTAGGAPVDALAPVMREQIPGVLLQATVPWDDGLYKAGLVSDRPAFDVADLVTSGLQL